MTIAEALAECFAEIADNEVPELPRTHAKMIIASTLASAACGSHLPSAAIIHALERERGGCADASIWFDAGPALPLTAAARVNAMRSDAAASDDSDLRNIVHAGTPATAAALAVAERDGAPGTAILTAIVLGYEAAGRISSAVSLGHGKQGFHGCVGAVFAAAVAAARLLRLSAAQTAHALALSATSIGGLAAAADTSIAREYHAGNAAMAGMQAALAAARGYTAELAIFEQRHGFCEVFGGTDAQAMTAGLGADWDIVTDMAIKLVPGGHPHHAIAQAAADASRKAGLRATEVAAIVVSRPGLTRLSGPLHPANLVDMAHSPAYFAAAGVADGRFGWEHATPQKIGDPAIHALIDKVRVGPQPEERPEAYRHGASVTVESRDGRRFTSTVFVPKGAGCIGIEWPDIDDKFRTLAAHAEVAHDAIEASLACMHQFERCEHVSTLLASLR